MPQPSYKHDETNRERVRARDATRLREVARRTYLLCLAPRCVHLLLFRSGPLQKNFEILRLAFAFVVAACTTPLSHNAPRTSLTIFSTVNPLCSPLPILHSSCSSFSFNASSRNLRVVTGGVVVMRRPLFVRVLGNIASQQREQLLFGRAHWQAAHTHTHTGHAHATSASRETVTKYMAQMYGSLPDKYWRTGLHASRFAIPLLLLQELLASGSRPEGVVNVGVFSLAVGYRAQIRQRQRRRL